MTHLFLVQGTVCAGTAVVVLVAVIVVVVDAVGAIGAVVVKIALLELLLSCAFIWLVLWRCPPKVWKVQKL